MSRFPDGRPGKDRTFPAAEQAAGIRLSRLAKKAKMPELDSFGGMFSVKIEADIAFVCHGKSLPFLDLPYP
jgi:hypothetical protein